MGGAMLGGGLVATDRRTSGIQLEDEGIELRSGARLRETLSDRGHLNITSYNRQVLVTGEVPTEQDKQKVSDIVSRVENVRTVVTERGTVHLLGRVTQREANRATELVRTIPGVKRVVRVLEIISEEELQRLQPPAPAPTPAPAGAAPATR